MFDDTGGAFLPVLFQSQIPVESHPKSIEAQIKSYQISKSWIIWLKKGIKKMDFSNMFFFLMTHEMSFKKKRNLTTFLRFWSPPTHASSADPSRPRVVSSGYEGNGVDYGRFMAGLSDVSWVENTWTTLMMFIRYDSPDGLFSNDFPDMVVEKPS